MADSAYASGDALDAFAAAGYDTAIKPIDPKARGFTRDDFAIDTDAQTVTCPAGHTKAVSTTSATGRNRRRTPRAPRGQPRPSGRVPPAAAHGREIHRLAHKT